MNIGFSMNRKICVLMGYCFSSKMTSKTFHPPDSYTKKSNLHGKGIKSMLSNDIAISNLILILTILRISNKLFMIDTFVY